MFSFRCSSMWLNSTGPVLNSILVLKYSLAFDGSFKFTFTAITSANNLAQNSEVAMLSQIGISLKFHWELLRGHPIRLIARAHRRLCRDRMGSCGNPD